MENDNQVNKITIRYVKILRIGFQVAIITLNNPSKLNALTEPMGEALIKQVEEVKTKPNVRAAIITGIEQV